MAKVKVLSIFHDLDTNMLRMPGDIVECTNARADVFNEKNLAEIIEKDSEIKPKEDKSEKPLYKKK
jgi:hypothetical protein